MLQWMQENNRYRFSINVQTDEVTMKAILKRSNDISFNSDVNKLLGFTEEYPGGTHKSECLLI